MRKEVARADASPPTGFLRAGLATLAGLGLSAAFATTPQSDQGNAAADRFLDLLREWNTASETLPVYLEARAEKEGGGSQRAQLVAMMASELGLYDAAVEAWPLGSGATRSQPSSLPPADAKVVDAGEAIARLARDHRVVVVNEAHHAAQTRAIFLDLLPRLRELGFDWYCAETLAEDDVGRLQREGYPVRASGVYSKEPVFGAVLRRAVRLGYSVCAYEAEGDSQQARETGQAENIARLLREHPRSRILVHAGYGHARKDITVHDARPMAAEIARLAGIEPLAVDQTTLAAVAARENRAYRPLLARLPPGARASVFVDAGGHPWSLEPAAYDVSVVLPSPPPRYGRAGWLWTIPGKVPVSGFDADCMDRYPCAIEARHVGEGRGAVSADIVVREQAEEAIPSLALFPGDYTLRFIGPDGAELRETSLKVDAASHQENH